jgi:hypothetical protein
MFQELKPMKYIVKMVYSIRESNEANDSDEVVEQAKHRTSRLWWSWFPAD